MTCPLCQQRKAKRACPALGRQICSTCCGTKRLKEIACPADCGYLASARAHPAAVVQRQRERDMTLLTGLLDGLSDSQADLLSRLHQELHEYVPTAVPAIVDADVRDALGAMASTLETAARGILYEHPAPSLPAQRLVTRFRPVQEEAERRAKLRPAAVATVFRRMEAAARDAASIVGGGETAFLAFLDRFQANPTFSNSRAAHTEAEPEPRDRPRIIVP